MARNRGVDIEKLENTLREINLELKVMERTSITNAEKERVKVMEEKINGIYNQTVPELKSKVSSLEKRVNIWSVLTAIAAIIGAYLKQ